MGIGTETRMSPMMHFQDDSGVQSSWNPHGAPAALYASTRADKAGIFSQAVRLDTWHPHVLARAVGSVCAEAFLQLESHGRIGRRDSSGLSGEGGDVCLAGLAVVPIV